MFRFIALKLRRIKNVLTVLMIIYYYNPDHTEAEHSDIDRQLDLPYVS